MNLNTLLKRLACLIDTFGVWSPQVKHFKKQWRHFPGFQEQAAYLLMYKDIIEDDGTFDLLLSLGLDPQTC